MERFGAVEVGGWLFRNRGWLPVPLVGLGLVFGPRYWGAGVGLMCLGEALRLAAVGHIGLPSRTRSDGVGPLVVTGPYARHRNPLYVGNLVLFTGFGVLTWPAALVVTPLLMIHYHFIVAWEEDTLHARLGADYARYVAEVPRWLPLGGGPAGRWSAARALRSERSTLMAIAAVLTILFLRSRAL